MVVVVVVVIVVVVVMVVVAMVLVVVIVFYSLLHNFTTLQLHHYHTIKIVFLHLNDRQTGWVMRLAAPT